MDNKTKIDVLSSAFLFCLALVIFFDLSWSIFGLIVLIWILSLVLLVRNLRNVDDIDLKE